MIMGHLRRGSQARRSDKINQCADIFAPPLTPTPQPAVPRLLGSAANSPLPLATAPPTTVANPPRIRVVRALRTAPTRSAVGALADARPPHGRVSQVALARARKPAISALSK